MRVASVCLALIIAASPSMAQTIAPGSPLLRLDRIHPYTDSISLVLIPKDSAQRIAGTLLRQVQMARDSGIAVIRETQVYTFATGKTEVDTLDVRASTLEAIRVVEINDAASHDLRFRDGRLTGVVWSADSGRKAVDTPLGAAFFHGMATESFLAAFPLAPNRTLHLPVGETPGATVHLATFRVTGTTTLRTATGGVQCLVVQESPTTVAWVSRASGRLMRLHWTLPNGTSIWKLPTRDIPFLDAQPTAFAASACTARHTAGQSPVPRANADLPRWLTLPEPPPMPRPDTSEIVAAAGGAQLYAAIFHRGGAAPVLLLHGGLENSNIWSSEVARLSPSHEVIVIDTRGHGRSTLGNIPLSYALFAADAIVVLDSLHIRSVAVVGTSDGGITGLRLAIDYAQRIDGLLTYGANFDSTGNPSATPDSGMEALDRLYVAHAKADYERVSPTPGSFAKLEIALGRLYAREPAISHAALQSIRAPTTIVDGDREQFVTRAHTERLASLIPGARLVIMGGVSHDGPLQDPDGFHRVVAKFLATT